MLSGWTQEIAVNVFDHLRANESSLLKQLLARPSSENWVSNLIASAFPAGADITAFDEVGYAALGVKDFAGEASKDKADMLLINWASRSFAAVEAAIVHPDTQSKWQAKIAKDWWKLTRIKRPDVDKLMFIYCLGSEPILSNPEWEKWWAKIDQRHGDYPTPTNIPLPVADFAEEFPMGAGTDHFALYIWQIR